MRWNPALMSFRGEIALFRVIYDEKLKNSMPKIKQQHEQTNYEFEAF